jgi:hypothetical protein
MVQRRLVAATAVAARAIGKVSPWSGVRLPPAYVAVSQCDRYRTARLGAQFGRVRAAINVSSEETGSSLTTRPVARARRGASLEWACAWHCAVLGGYRNIRFSVPGIERLAAGAFN